MKIAFLEKRKLKAKEKLDWAQKEEGLKKGYVFDITGASYVSKKDRLLVLMLRALIVTAVVWGTIGCLVSAFAMPCNLLLVGAATFVFSIVLGALYDTKFVYNIALIVIFVLLLYVLLRLFAVFNSGFSAVSNIVIEKIDDVYGINAYRTYEEMIPNRYFTITAVFCLLGSMGALIVNSLYNSSDKLAIIMIAFYIILGMGFYVDCIPGTFWLFLVVWGTAFNFVGVTCDHSKVVRKNRGIRYPFAFKRKKRKQMAADNNRLIYYNYGKGMFWNGAALTGICTVLALLLGGMNLSGTYAQTPVATTKVRHFLNDTVRNVVVNGISGLFGEDDGSGGVNSGRIGGTNSVHLDFQTDVIVQFVPYTFDRIFLKERDYVHYDNNMWYEADACAEDFRRAKEDSGYSVPLTYVLAPDNMHTGEPGYYYNDYYKTEYDEWVRMRKYLRDNYVIYPDEELLYGEFFKEITPKNSLKVVNSRETGAVFGEDEIVDVLPNPYVLTKMGEEMPSVFSLANKEAYSIMKVDSLYRGYSEAESPCYFGKMKIDNVDGSHIRVMMPPNPIWSVNGGYLPLGVGVKSMSTMSSSESGLSDYTGYISAYEDYLYPIINEDSFLAYVRRDSSMEQRWYEVEYAGINTDAEIFSGYDEEDIYEEIKNKNYMNNWLYQFYESKVLKEDYYLEVPEKLEYTISKFCDDNGICGDREEVIEALKKTFREDFMYTYSPGKTPKGKDAVEYFLNEQKEGYCVYFASSATLILRHNGIPARYCEGYALDPEEWIDAEVLQDENAEEWFRGTNPLGQSGVVSVELTDSSAHAWVEIYYEGYGWVPVEFTVAQRDESDYADMWSQFADLFNNVENNGMDLNLGNNNNPGNNMVSADEFRDFLTKTACRIFWGALIAFALVMIVSKTLEYLKLYRIGNEKKQMVYQYHMINSLLWNSDRMNVRRPNNYHSRTGDVLKTECNMDADEVEKWLTQVVRCSYSPAEPTGEEYRAAVQTYRKAKKAVYRRMKPLRRIKMWLLEGNYLH